MYHMGVIEARSPVGLGVSSPVYWEHVLSSMYKTAQDSNRRHPMYTTFTWVWAESTDKAKGLCPLSRLS